MPFSLEEVVPWGRSFKEYVAMFALTEADLQKRILGCSDGPAAFNADLTRRDGKIISVDPLYQFSADEIKRRIDETYPLIMDQVAEFPDEFVWTYIPTLEDLGRIRMDAMNTFLKDYPQGKQDGRYVEASLPKLPFEDHSFDLVLTSHFLFLYSPQFSFDFHMESIRELCRIAPEVRIFPLLELGSKPSRYVEPVLEQLQKEGYHTEILPVDFEFQKGGNEMLRVTLG